MSQSMQIANRLREVILNGTWIANTNYKDQLSNVTWEQAVTKVGSYNTIAALTFHINYYIAGVLNVFEGGSLDIKDKYSFDLPPIQAQRDWEKLMNALFTNAEKLVNIIEHFPEEKLKEVFVNEKYGTYQRNIDAIIEHCYYHLGQISLIKKAILQIN